MFSVAITALVVFTANEVMTAGANSSDGQAS